MYFQIKFFTPTFQVTICFANNSSSLSQLLPVVNLCFNKNLGFTTFELGLLSVNMKQSIPENLKILRPLKQPLNNFCIKVIIFVTKDQLQPDASLIGCTSLFTSDILKHSIRVYYKHPRVSRYHSTLTASAIQN